MASVIHDTDFDERVRMLRKNVHERLSGHHQGLGIPTDDLSGAIDGLYSAFAWRRLSDPFEYCDCCITAATAGRLRGPLHSLDADDLYTISANFPHTAGKREDILYFTPRILEHAASESCYLDLSEIFSKFQEQPPALNEDEVAAIDRFFQLVWTALKEVDPYHPLGVVNVVLPTAVLTGKIATYLDLWRESPAIYRYVASWNDEGTLGEVFWDRGSEAQRSVVDWFRTNREALLGNFDRYSAALAAQSAELVETAKHRLATLS